MQSLINYLSAPMHRDFTPEVASCNRRRTEVEILECFFGEEMDEVGVEIPYDATPMVSPLPNQLPAQIRYILARVATPVPTTAQTPIFPEKTLYLSLCKCNTVNYEFFTTILITHIASDPVSGSQIRKLGGAHPSSA
jgi:hypothetical protein